MVKYFRSEDVQKMLEYDFSDDNEFSMLIDEDIE